ncbi:ABC transporter ATP-binding protein [Alphaproteobacteria bacterium]|nr:ABC transporter ATP-binding protein [Alphaproteobacteria bacterium]
MNDLALEVKNLSVKFNVRGQTIKAVNDVSWGVKKGETLAIVGESGSGKSVSALAILKLIPDPPGKITSGSIFYEGEDITKASDRKIRDIRGKNISMIFQEPMTSLNPLMTIGKQISETLDRHFNLSRKEIFKKAIDILDLVQIPDSKRWLNGYPHEMSGGMRQRVMIAMALVCRPSILIADEPTTALDVTIQSQILGLIKKLQNEIGMSVIFITHDMGVVAEIADRVVVMLRGKKVEEGHVNEIFHNPKHPYTKSLLSVIPKLGSMKGRPLPAKFSNLDVKRSEGDDVIETNNNKLIDIKDNVRRSDPPILEITNLTTRFSIKSGFGFSKGNIHAVEGINLLLQQGETLGIVGESGCGKSTLGKSIMRLVEPTSGRIKIKGKDIISLSKKDMFPIRKDVQIVFQDPYSSLNPRFTVGKIVSEGMLLHQICKETEVRDKLIEIFEKVGLSEFHLNNYPHEFSGGQRQRIGLARALALSPSIIIADEAVSALDVSIQAQVVNLMMELQEEYGLSYLFISHDMAVIERVCHRVAVMYLGEIVEIGTRSQVFENPQHPYTKKLMKAVPVADPRLRKNEFNLMTDEIPSLVKPVGYEPEKVDLIKIEEGHFIKAHN